MLLSNISTIASATIVIAKKHYHSALTCRITTVMHLSWETQMPNKHKLHKTTSWVIDWNSVHSNFHDGHCNHTDPSILQLHTLVNHPTVAYSRAQQLLHTENKSHWVMRLIQLTTLELCDPQVGFCSIQFNSIKSAQDHWTVTAN